MATAAGATTLRAIKAAWSFESGAVQAINNGTPRSTASIGVQDARIGVRGSSVTGESRKGGSFRWSGSDPSDVDFFIESQTLAEGLRTSNNIERFVHPDRVMK